MTINNHIWSYVIGVISGLTIPILYKVYIYITCKYPSKKLWKEYISKENYGILSCSDSVIDIDSLSTGVYDLMSLAEIKEKLSSFSNTSLRIYSCKRFPPDLNHNNIILFGGPISNTLTRIVMVDKELTSLQFKDHKIINTKNNKLFEPEIKNNKIVKDYGLIIKMKNPFNSKLKLMIVAGCFDYGTHLSASTLIEPALVKHILKVVGNDDFEIVVSGDIIEGVPQTPIVEEGGFILRGNNP